MPPQPEASWAPISVGLFHYLPPPTQGFEKAMTNQVILLSVRKGLIIVSIYSFLIRCSKYRCYVAGEIRHITTFRSTGSFL